jgi:hypothetical protein
MSIGERFVGGDMGAEKLMCFISDSVFKLGVANRPGNVGTSGVLMARVISLLGRRQLSISTPLHVFNV